MVGTTLKMTYQPNTDDELETLKAAVEHRPPVVELRRCSLCGYHRLDAPSAYNVCCKKPMEVVFEGNDGPWRQDMVKAFNEMQEEQQNIPRPPLVKITIKNK